MQATNKQRLTIVFCLSILLLPTILFAIFATPDRLVRLFPDDAFYYLQIAFNAAHLKLVSFDGIVETNGFHPLQFLISIFFASFLSKENLLRFAIVENGVLIAATAAVLAAYLFPRHGRVTQLLFAIFFAFPIWYLYVWLDAGMEMGLVFFCGILFYCWWQTAYENTFASLSDNCRLAASAAWLLLARLDMSIPLLPFAIAYIYFVGRERRGLRYILVPALVAVSFLLPYLAWNWTKFGHLVPISGMVKAASSVDFRANWRALTSGSAIGAILSLLPLMTATAVLRFGNLSAHRRVSFLLLMTSEILYYAYILFIAKQVFRWYLAFSLVLQSIGIALLLSKWLQNRKPTEFFFRASTAIGAALICAGLHAVFYLWAANLDTTSLHLKRIADDLNSHLTERDIVATYDAGIVGYFSKARVVNLDGLANSYEYYESYLRTNRVNDYFAKVGATYYLARVGGTASPAGSQVVASYRIPGQFDLVLYRLAQ